MRGEAAEATRGSAVRLAAEGGARALSLVTTLLIARGLGASSFGEFAFLSGIALVLAELADLGLHGTVPRALLSGELGLAGMVRAKLVLLGGFVAAASLLGLMWPVLAILMAYFAASGWAEFFGVALRTWGNRGEEAAVLVALRLSTLLAVAAVVATQGGLAALAWAHAASTLPVIALAGALVARRRVRDESRRVEPVLDVLRVSAPLAVTGGLALLNLRIELIVLRLVRGTEEAGMFAAALRVVEALNAVPAAVNAGAMPALTREGLRGEGPVRERTAHTLALLAVPAAVGLTLVAPGVVVLLYGETFVPASGPLRILAWALVPLFMTSLMLHALIAVGRARDLPRLTALRVLVAAFLAMILASRFGAAGAASGFLVSEVVMVVMAWRSCRSAGFPVPVLRSLAAASLVSVPMAAAVRMSGGGLAVSIGAGVLAYAAVLVPVWWLTRRRRPQS